MSAGERLAYRGAAWHDGVPYRHDGLIQLERDTPEGWLATTAAGSEILVPHADLAQAQRRAARHVCGRCLRWHSGPGPECVQCAGVTP